MQMCRWEFLVFSGTFETRLTVHEARQHGEVVFNLISSSFMRQFQGAWKVCLTPSSLQHHIDDQKMQYSPDPFESCQARSLLDDAMHGVAECH